jgi:hypothetical protein
MKDENKLNNVAIYFKKQETGYLYRLNAVVLVNVELNHLRVLWVIYFGSGQSERPRQIKCGR